TEKVRFVLRKLYNREQYVTFDSDVGHFVGETPYGEKVAWSMNNNPEMLGYYQDQADTLCPQNYELSAPFLTDR
ncbi:HB2L protein, partial [Zosterops hypoxanthus]|nr:HB2L protein [Zosterops hypoxanthus]